MKCPKCDHESPGTGKFCSECGGKLVPPTKPPADPAVIVCNGTVEDGSRCLEELQASQKFCSNCGQKVDPQLFTSQSNSIPPQTGETNAHAHDDMRIEKRKHGAISPDLLENKSKRSKCPTNVIHNEAESQQMSEKYSDKIHTSRKRKSKDAKTEVVVKKQTSMLAYLSNRQIDSAPHLSSKDTQQPLSPEAGNKVDSEIPSANDNSNNNDKQEQSTEDQTESAPHPVVDENQRKNDNKVDSTNVNSNNNDPQETGTNREHTVKKESKENVAVGKLRIFDETKNNPSKTDGDEVEDVKKENIENTDNAETDKGKGCLATGQTGNLTIVDESEDSKSSGKQTTDNVDPDKDECLTNGKKDNVIITHDNTEADRANGNKPSDTQLGKPKTVKVEGTSTSAQPDKPEHDKASDKETSHGSKHTNKDEEKEDIDSPSNDSTENEESFVFGGARTWNKGKTGNATHTNKDEEKEDIDSPSNDSTENEESFVFGGARTWNKGKTGNATQTNASSVISLFDAPNKVTTRSSEDKKPTDNEEGTSVDGDDNVDDSGSVDGEENKKSRRQKKNQKRKEKAEESKNQDGEEASSNGKQPKSSKNTEQKKSNKNAAGDKQTGTTSAATKTSGPQTRSHKDVIRVHFHVLVSAEFKFDSKERRLVLKSKHFNEWKDDINMTVKRMWDNKPEMILTLEIPRGKITNDSKLYYKYCMINEDSKYEYEHYRVGSKTGVEANRTLSIPPKWNKKDEWHQYDGVVERDLGFFKTTVKKFNPWNDLKKNAKLTVETFSSTICHGIVKDFDIQEGLDLLEILMSGVRKVYYVENKCWSDEKDFKTETAEYLVKTMLSHQDKQLKGDETEQQLEKRLVICLGCVRVVKTIGVSLSEQDAKVLCNSLKIKPDTTIKECMEIKLAEKYFTNRTTLKDSFLYVVKQMAEHTTDPSWLFLMPWIHFLSGVVQPYQAIPEDFSHDKQEPVWWGIKDIHKQVGTFKSIYSKWSISVHKLIDELLPLFEMDYLLPRTLMAAIDLDQMETVIHTEKIPMEVCIASLIYFLRTTRPEWTYMYYGYGLTKAEQKVQDCASALFQQLKGCFNSDKDVALKTRWKMCKKFSVKLLSESTQSNRAATMYYSAQISVRCLAMYHRIEQTEGQDHCLAGVDTLTGMIIGWLIQYAYNWEYYMEENFKIWNQVLAPVDLQSETVRDIWNPILIDHFTHVLKKEVGNHHWRTTKLIRLYCDKTDQFHPALQECLSKIAFEIISNGYTIDYSGLNTDGHKRFGMLLSNMFNAEWYKASNISSDQNLHDDKKILNHVLRWKPFLHFLKIRDKDQEKLELFDETCVTRMIQGVSVVDGVISDLLDGTITKGTLDLVCSPGNRFDEIAAHVKTEKTKTAPFFKRAMDIRQKEMKAFLEQAVLMTTLTSLCEHVPNVDRQKVDKTLGKQRNIEVHSIKEFCRPASVESVDDIETYQPKLCAFQVDATVIDILPQVHHCNNSSTFMKLWREGAGVGDETLSLEDVVRQVWTPVKQRWDNIAAQIKNGEISFQILEKLIGRTYRDNFEGMESELRAMNIPRDIINERLKQLEQYRHLENCVYGAKTILQFAQKYNLKGDFEDITTIASYDGSRELQMRYFDANLMNTCKFLGELTKERATCLSQFVDCHALVGWLKESMHTTGLKELKVFVDLAFMSAGDEPINVKRVQCLHSAVTGYAPLIFDLRPEDGYKQLLVKCDLVWKELKANPDLPKQLRDTNRQLEWLKDIKKAHGSVEVTSLVQAEAINACGVYTVGKGAWRNKPEIANKDGLLSVLQLTVSEVEGKRQMRNYTFDQLQDLQSRLMLVAGKAEKGNESVETFTSVFDSIIRLSKMYNKLCSAGCVLFKAWTAQFLCDTKRKACAILEFGDNEEVPKLKAFRTKHENLREIIPQLANFMESCYEDWLAYIKDKRKEYLHLNYFTVDQLVILQKELVKCGTDEQPSDRIYPLLSAVKRDCTPGDLIEAMEEAKVSLEQSGDTASPEPEVVEEAEEDTDEELKQKFIDEMVTSGYDRTLAIRALEHVSPEDFDDGILWCINHQDDELDPDDSMETDPGASGDASAAAAAATAKAGFSGWSTKTDSSIQSLITDQIMTTQTGKSGAGGFKPLSDKLEQLWKNFLNFITFNVKDYLSLEHLGLILRCLARRNTFSVDRKMPPGYVEGSPNLLVCPNGDVLPLVLSLYMLCKDQPLPQSDEVLLCTPQTTIDEVNIFWNRALFGDSRKLYCLASVDLLDYDVSDVAERLLEENLQSGKHCSNYKLVVICGSDNENRSRIVSSLDNCRRALLPINIRSIQEILAQKLQITDKIDGFNPASFLDFNKSTVRLVTSWRAGVGKTLYRSRREAELANLNPAHTVTVKAGVSIPLQEKVVDLHYVIERLLKHTPTPGNRQTMVFHLDVAHEVQHGVDYLLFNLLVLGCVMDKTGYVWRKSLADLYLIETMPLMIHGNTQKAEDVEHVHKMLSILPTMTCRSPQESLQIYEDRKPPDYKESDQLFDNEQFHSPVFQRPFQYLRRYDRGESLQNIDAYTAQGEPAQCLATLLRHCGVQDPSWAELHHFVWFLNTQLRDYETNNFVCAAAAEDLPGFAKFVLRFLIQMSRDFSTRSLNMSEQSPGVQYDPQQLDAQDIAQYQMRRTWESSPHPYLFINYDSTFTFLGFNIERATGNMIDQQSGDILEQAIMAQNLYDSLVRHSVPIQENFDALPRHEKIMRLCSVMGLEMPHDPDDTYELTTDNVKKIMAIYMRFRCDIPVIIMGETGCGKTRLVKFMCSLQMPPGLEVNNMILMKVHGGTTNRDIKRKVREAERVAQTNLQEYGKRMFTVLFFDEANTTEAIGLIKEIMCDKTMEGTKLRLCENLKIVAACNPYRRHSDELIKKLEQAGLGYHVDAEETSDKLGRVPMRRLVYRVQPLPQSLLPLVWDFGQLNTQVEDLYIRQMVRRYIREDKLPDIPRLVEVVSGILTASQDYMRQQKDECSFVSLRDVDRVLCMMSWFYQQSQNGRTLYECMDDELEDIDDSDYSSVDEEEGEIMEDNSDRVDTLDDITRSLVLALGVCYHACLKNREQYRQHVAHLFMQPCHLPGGEDQMEKEISCCQDVFLSSVQLEKNIARNMALKENVFMMVVCIELRIPLFLVGKPGSSKSLAKTIVSDAMQGNASREDLFKELKQAQMVSFQCSPLATPDGIVGTFRQCAQFQKDKDLSSFVSIVVLDEVGLAEDSPRMPLKTLHPLLEDGCQGDEEPEEHKKVAFIGISNWALDPAKMNRGILVQREVPDLEELENSARGICTTDDNEDILDRIKPLIKPMAKSYLEVFENVSKQMREFYGLRDFYSLVKMVYAFTEKSRKDPTWNEMRHAILRNFGGLDQVDPVDSFKKHLYAVKPLDERKRRTDPDCTPKGLIEACLFDINKMQSESRYLLLLTENYGALTILQQEILARQTDIRPITIFGSSFRRDQEYTQVCRNINKIKVCMETGNTVVLLNLENLYESLYDALNQYYVYFGGERYVDLGLGTHRVKCPVHKNFRLIVVAEKQIVYKKFPIPLINRLEKHFLTLGNMLSPEQQQLAERLKTWADNFVQQNGATQMYRRNEKAQTLKVGDVFMGYHDDTCAAVVIHVWATTGEDVDTDHTLQCAKELMLWCATPDAVVRLSKSSLPVQEQKQLKVIYQQQQTHDGIVQYLHQIIVQEKRKQLFAQVTTHSKLLPSSHKVDLGEATGIALNRILLLDTLSSFDTEQQFSNKIHQFFRQCGDSESLLVVQCDSGDKNANLVACARYCVMDEYESIRQELTAAVHVVFIIQLPRIAGGCFTGFQCGVWHSVHIDDLRVAEADLPTVGDMEGRSVAALIENAVKAGQEPMETDNLNNTQREQEFEPMEWRDSEAISEHQEPGREPDQQTGEEREPARGQPDLYARSAAPLDIEDVMISLENVGKRGQTEGPRKGLNVRGLVLSCVQAALAMVKDRKEHLQRTTDRVPLVLALFHHNTGHQSFLTGVCQLIAALLREKEFLHTHMANQWLVEEAAKHENINKAGTFRRSCLQTLESKIAPVLAGIIAFLDTNQNLDILQEQQEPWKAKLWFAVLNTPKVIPLNYADLQSPKRQSDLPEVIVKTTGYDSQMYKGQMPFSWLIFKQIEEVLSQPSKTKEYDEETSKEEKIELYVTVLRESGLGKILERITGELAVEDALTSYLNDLVYIVYKVSNAHEHMLVHQSIRFVTNQMLEQLSGTQLLHRLVCAHLAHKQLAPRLVYFHAMNCVWPECSSAIVELKEKNPDHYMFKEEEFTYSALCLLIEGLHPGKNGLNSPALRSLWLQRVHSYRQVIEKVLSLHTEDPSRCGTQSLQSIRRASGLWSRVVVVKLFLEHVCTSDDKEAITIKHCMPLWTLLGEEANLKELRSLESVERFLKSCNQRAMREILGQVETCCHCETNLEGPPIVLPCKHILCDNCLHDISALGDIVCPKCKAKVPEKWNPVRQTKDRKANQKMQDYQKRCNSFFMDVVSQLCFANNTPPSEDVMNKLMQYILTTRLGTKQKTTKELSIFDTGIDPTPVFRSFLLQLLMRTSKETVTSNLNMYLKEAETFIERDITGKESHYVQLSQLIIQCFEDLFLKEAVSKDGDDLVMATQYLRDARYTIDTDQLDVEKLRGIAEARVGLAIAAKYIAETVNMDPLQRCDRNVRKLIEAAQVLCSDLKTRMPRTYLVKYLCRCYSIDTYQAVCRSQHHFLRWVPITNLETNQRVECVDRYVVCGDRYTRIREALTKVIIGEEVQHLMHTLQELHTAGGYTEVFLQLAIHREITNANLYPEREQKCTKQVIQSIEESLNKNDRLQHKTLLGALLYNKLSAQHLLVREAENLNQQGLQCVLVHFICALGQLPSGTTLLQPLIALAQAPQTYQNAYLPTMPQDDLDEVREALLEARNMPGGGGENPVFYRCPNGHPYVIGDCGRPAYVGTCKTCGAEIGGQGYRLRPGNQLEQGKDQTATGHILGRVAARGQGPRPERTLNRIQCACVRLLTHLAMFTGTTVNEQSIQSLIKPDIMVGETAEFLWQHIKLDVEDIQRAIGKSMDEVFLLIHAILHAIMIIHQPGANVKAEIHQLSSKKGRTDWEQAFCLKYLKPLLQDTDKVLRENNQLILQDERLGSDPLLCLLYETESQQEEVQPGLLQDIPSSWRYRTPISVHHLQQALDAHVSTLSKTKQKQQLAVLQQFLREDHHLQALRYVPSILKLQRLLYSRYQRKLDKEEATTIKIDDLKRVVGHDGSALIQEFAEAWDLLRGDLKSYVCPTDMGGMVVSKEYCTQPVTDNTPIAILLPTTKEMGLCSYALLDFLFRKQNGFLDHYCKATGRNQSSFLTISPGDVTASHLISYDPQQDILPLVMANCKYSFQMGQGTKIEYDFVGLEKQLMDRLLFSKSRITLDGPLQIEQMVYRAEVTNALVFKKLADKIPQECLNGAVKSQIVSDIRSLPDVCTSLDNLGITISFLTSVGGSPHGHLQEFMLNILKMETSLYSQKARDECQFRHAQALWLLLSLMKSKQLADHHQSREVMFENIESKYHEELSAELLGELRLYMRPLSVEKLSQLVEVLHEYIVLDVSVRDNTNVDDYVDKSNKQLFGWLYGYIEDLERPSLDLQILDGFPNEVYIRHSSHTWLEAYEMLKEKQTGQRH